MFSIFQGSCDSGNRDCNCVDSSFAGCTESAAENKVLWSIWSICKFAHFVLILCQIQLHVTNLEECIFQCDFFHSFQGTNEAMYTYMYTYTYIYKCIKKVTTSKGRGCALTCSLSAQHSRPLKV